MGGSLEYKEIKSMNMQHGTKCHENIEMFVETGTYKADTTLEMSKLYKNVFTTEIHKGLWEAAIIRAEKEQVSNIAFLLGDSLTLLQHIAPKASKGAVFFLDAHISGSDSSWNGNNRVPLLEELNVIARCKIGASLFILDDLRFWKGEQKAAWDWAHISQESVLNIFKKNNINVTSYTKYNDRFWVWTN